MKDEILVKKIRNKSIYRMLISLPILLAGIAAACALYYGGLLSADGFIYPHEVTTLSEIDAIQKKPFAEDALTIQLAVEPENLVDAGISLSEDSHKVGHYLAAYLDGKYVLCLIRNDKYNTLNQDEGYTFTGKLSRLDEDAVSMVLNDMAEQGISKDEAKDLLYAYSIDTVHDGIVYRLSLYALMLVLLIFGARMLIQGLIPALNVMNHKSLKKLSAYEPVEMMMQDLEQQYAAAGPDSVFRLRKGSNTVYLLKNWLVIESPMDIRIIRSDDLLWAYKSTRQTRHYGITTSRHFAMLMTRSRSESVQGGSDEIAGLLPEIAKAYPWTVVGYSDELEKIWKTDRDRLIAYSKSRKAEM